MAFTDKAIKSVDEAQSFMELWNAQINAVYSGKATTIDTKALMAKLNQVRQLEQEFENDWDKVRANYTVFDDEINPLFGGGDEGGRKRSTFRESMDEISTGISVVAGVQGHDDKSLLELTLTLMNGPLRTFVNNSHEFGGWVNECRHRIDDLRRSILRKGPLARKTRTISSISPTMPSLRPWPKISIVTPSYNQGWFIEQTILSVANQGYPNVEHIICDGGSDDETLRILERHKGALNHIISEKDRGQSDAINKGMALANGEILTWLNSDDMLAPGALASIALAFAESKADMVAGICEVYRDGALVHRHLTSCADGALPLDDLLDLDGGWNAGQFFYQPEVFFTRDIWERAGGHVDEHLHYSMDYDLWLRFAAAGAKLHVIGRPIAMFRQHVGQKTHTEANFKAELARHRRDYLSRTGYASSAVRPAPDHSRSLRILMLNDHGWKWGAGIAHYRVAQACRMGGHTVAAIAFAEAARDCQSTDHVLKGIADVAPDIVLIGNLHGAALAPATIGAISARWPTFVFLHDLWWLTGRCVYTQGCGKLRSGCDATCPTPDEYPKLEPGLIRQAWIEKRAVLAQPSAPVLLAYSNWAQSVASEALSVTGDIAAERFVLGLPTNVFRPRDKVAARARLGLPQDKFIVLFTATNLGDFRKGTDRLHALVEGFDHPDIMFVAVGRGAIDGAHAATKITTLPYRKDPEDVAELYAAVDVILGASREETLCQIYTEAAACGTPSVAFANSGVREAVVQGVTGRLADVETVDALRDILLRLFSDSHYRDSMSRWGRLHAENEWSLEASYRSLFQVWRRHGIVDRFGLAHKISLSQPNPDISIETTTWDTGGAWRPKQGVGPEEGPFPDRGINNQFRWLYFPLCELEFSVPEAGRYRLTLRVQNQLFERQSVGVFCDGKGIGRVEMLRKTGENFDTIELEGEFGEGRHTPVVKLYTGLQGLSDARRRRPSDPVRQLRHPASLDLYLFLSIISLVALHYSRAEVVK